MEVRGILYITMSRAPSIEREPEVLAMADIEKLVESMKKKDDRAYRLNFLESKTKSGTGSKSTDEKLLLQRYLFRATIWQIVLKECKDGRLKGEDDVRSRLATLYRDDGNGLLKIAKSCGVKTDAAITPPSIVGAILESGIDPRIDVSEVAHDIGLMYAFAATDRYHKDTEALTADLKRMRALSSRHELAKRGDIEVGAKMVIFDSDKEKYRPGDESIPNNFFKSVVAGWNDPALRPGTNEPAHRFSESPHADDDPGDSASVAPAPTTLIGNAASFRPQLPQSAIRRPPPPSAASGGRSDVTVVAKFRDPAAGIGSGSDAEDDARGYGRPEVLKKPGGFIEEPSKTMTSKAETEVRMASQEEYLNNKIKEVQGAAQASVRIATEQAIAKSKAEIEQVRAAKEAAELERDELRHRLRSEEDQHMGGIAKMKQQYEGQIMELQEKVFKEAIKGRKENMQLVVGIQDSELAEALAIKQELARVEQELARVRRDNATLVVESEEDKRQLEYQKQLNRHFDEFIQKTLAKYGGGFHGEVMDKIMEGLHRSREATYRELQELRFATAEDRVENVELREALSQVYDREALLKRDLDARGFQVYESEAFIRQLQDEKMHLERVISGAQNDAARFAEEADQLREMLGEGRRKWDALVERHQEEIKFVQDIGRDYESKISENRIRLSELEEGKGIAEENLDAEKRAMVAKDEEIKCLKAEMKDTKAFSKKSAEEKEKMREELKTAIEGATELQGKYKATRERVVAEEAERRKLRGQLSSQKDEYELRIGKYADQMEEQRRELERQVNAQVDLRTKIDQLRKQRDEAKRAHSTLLASAGEGGGSPDRPGTSFIKFEDLTPGKRRSIIVTFKDPKGVSHGVNLGESKILTAEELAALDAKSPIRQIRDEGTQMSEPPAVAGGGGDGSPPHGGIPLTDANVAPTPTRQLELAAETTNAETGMTPQTPAVESETADAATGMTAGRFAVRPPVHPPYENPHIPPRVTPRYDAFPDPRLPREARKQVENLEELNRRALAAPLVGDEPSPSPPRGSDTVVAEGKKSPTPPGTPKEQTMAAAGGGGGDSGGSGGSQKYYTPLSTEASASPVGDSPQPRKVVAGGGGGGGSSSPKGGKQKHSSEKKKKKKTPEAARGESSGEEEEEEAAGGSGGSGDEKDKSPSAPRNDEKEVPEHVDPEEDREDKHPCSWKEVKRSKNVKLSRLIYDDFNMDSVLSIGYDLNGGKVKMDDLLAFCPCDSVTKHLDEFDYLDLTDY